MNSHNDSGLLRLRVHPNARRNEVVGFIDEVLQIRVAAPPVKGKANSELILILSQLLEVSPSSQRIVKGHTSRSKVITVDSLSHEDIIRRLST